VAHLHRGSDAMRQACPPRHLEVMSLTEVGSVTTTLRVLAIGSSDSCNAVRDAHLKGNRCRLIAATSYVELNAISIQEEFDIAILDQTLSHSELRNACEYIRRKWPSTKILVICKEPEALDDPLYDERALPEMSSKTLLAMIERMTKWSR
jgi:hypothetical protein